MSDYERNKRLVRQRKTNEDNHYKKHSKQKLISSVRKKIMTTMIGALETLEVHFGFLWEGSDNDKEKQLMYERYQDARQEILDRGNEQIKAIENEFRQYDVEWQRYHLDMKVVKNG